MATMQQSQADTVITAGPPATTNVAVATFTFSSTSSGANFECSLDEAAFAPCSSPVSFTDLGEGRHTLSVRAADDVGNVDPPPATLTWTVDLTAPQAPEVISPARGSFVASHTPGLEGTAEPGTTVVVTVDGVQVGTAVVDDNGRWTFTLPAQADGPHDIVVVSVDAAGNGSAPGGVRVTIDSEAPAAPEIDSPADEVQLADSTPDVSGTAEPGAVVTVSVDSLEVGTVTADANGDWRFTLPTLADGPHEVSATARDAAGNRSATRSINFVVDTAAPAAPLVTSPADGTWLAQASFVVTGTAEPGVSVRIFLRGQVVGAVVANAAGTWSVQIGPLAEGSHLLSLSATDLAGNTSAVRTVRVGVDTTAPDTSITAGPGSPEPSGTAGFTFATDDPTASFECSLDRNSWAPCDGQLTLTDVPDGDHTLRVRAVDAVGNVDASPAVWTWTAARDTDGDGLSDAEELQLGTDPNSADTDSDGLPDALELASGRTDPRDDDSDDDGLLDGNEDADNDGIVGPGETDPAQADTDGDGLTDGLELGLTAPQGTGTDLEVFVADADPGTRTDPTKRDTDGAGVFDGFEDANRNGRVDEGETDPLNPNDDTDADGDGIDNDTEREIGSDPFNPDSDGDGRPDGVEGTDDPDGDGLPDVLDPDSDNDGLADGEEDSNLNGIVDPGETDPRNADTDGDGLSDKVEVDHGRDPLQPLDGYEVEGGGCSSSGAGALVWLAPLLLLSAWPGRRLRRVLVSTGVFLLVLPTAARAQSLSTSIDIQQFRAGPGATDLLNVLGTEVLAPLRWSAGLFGHYADDPLALVNPVTGERRIQLIDRQASAELVAAMGLFHRVELGLVAPVTLQTSSRAGAVDDRFANGVATKGLGDLRLVPRVLLLPMTAGFQISAALAFTLPTGAATAFLGSGSPRFQPRLLLSWGGLDEVRVLANVGVNLQKRQEFLNLRVGNELAWAIAAAVPFRLGNQRFEAMASASGVKGLESSGPGSSPAEALLGLKYRVTPAWSLSVAAGRGIVRGYGSTDGRVVGGIVFTPGAAQGAHVEDADRDDRCPLGPDGGDGCPVSDSVPAPAATEAQAAVVPVIDPDPDGDGILGDKDLCPNIPEDFDHFEDDDGCFDPDNDGDGIPDAVDQCPSEPETINGNADDDGCPDPGKPMVKVEATRLVVLGEIRFKAGTDRILPTSFNLLDQVAATLRANPQILRIRVEGHTGSGGGREANLTLSQRQAESVVQYLVDKGIIAGRMEPVGYGASRPIVPNRIARGHEKNRRVEFVIMEQR